MTATKEPVPRRVKRGSTVSVETPPLTRVGRSSDEPQQVVMISIDKLHRHPKNRVIDPASLADLVQSLQEHGQREPIRVRPLPDPIGHYEIISGERRFLASQWCEPKFDSLKAIIETSGDAAALIDLAVANAAREDLDPIQRAELMIELMLPVDQGGAGMDKAAAGRVFGLNSESGVKNALRLLNLPQFFRDLLQSKQVPVNKVRPLCAYPKGLLEHFAKWLQDKKSPYRMEGFLQPMRDDDDQIDDEILDFVDRDTRSCDAVTQSLGYQVGNWPCLFKLDELTDKQREELQIFEVPHRERWNNKLPPNATRLVAVNTKLWHKLQDPLITKAKEQQKSKGSKAKAAAAVKGEAVAKPTAAELKAKRKKADDQLEHYTREWIVRALRYHLSESSLWCNGANQVMWLLPWLLASSYETSQMASWNEWAMVDLARNPNAPGKSKLAGIKAVEFITQPGACNAFYESLWRVVLWPARNGNYGHDDLAPAGTIPERMPGFSGRVIHELAEACGVSIETVWHASAKDSMQRALVKQWLMRHTADQLTDLGVALGHRLMGGKREERVDELLSVHVATPGKKAVLKLPPMISKLVGKKGGAK
jgi:ParB family transcriptional regulator, chromosome partitioning protein